QIKQARETIDKQRAGVLTMQSRVALQDTRIADALTSIRQGREDVLRRLFVRDGPAIWSAELRSSAPQDVLEVTSSSLFTQWAALGFYVERQRAGFFSMPRSSSDSLPAFTGPGAKCIQKRKMRLAPHWYSKCRLRPHSYCRFFAVAGSIRRHP